MITRAHLALLGTSGLLLLTACEDDDGFFTTFPSPTEIAVHPADFLGEVACSTNVGALQSYVVTLSAYDDENDSTAFTVASSLASSCARTVGFRDRIVIGQRYTVEIDGYELDASSLIPFGGVSSGSRQMQQISDGEIVAPRWSTTCGGGAADATEAIANQQQFVAPCEPLSDHAPSSTAIHFPPSAALGSDPCASASSFALYPQDNPLSPISGIACDAPAVVFDQVTPGSYTFYALTTDAEQPVRGSECFVQAQSGQTVTPLCQELSAYGHARFSIAHLKVGGAAVCPPGSSFNVLTDAIPLNSVPLPCHGEALIGPLEPGLQLLDVVIIDEQGQASSVEVSCGADIEPGRTVDGICVL